MTAPDNPDNSDNPDQEGPGGENSPQPLPPGVPEPPDLAKVRDLRQRMEKDRAGRRRGRRFNQQTGQQARDIGTYTIIPMMMVAGPLVGYLLGKGIENMFGGEPWPGVIGLLVGLVAAFRQIFLLLAAKTKQDREK